MPRKSPAFLITLSRRLHEHTSDAHCRRIPYPRPRKGAVITKWIHAWPSPFSEFLKSSDTSTGLWKFPDMSSLDYGHPLHDHPLFDLASLPTYIHHMEPLLKCI